MPYATPTDLPKVDVTWRAWPLAERVKDSLAITTHTDGTPYTDDERMIAIAVTMNEQPGKIPVGNVAGLMCMKATYPWGWGGFPVRPVGYAVIGEGQTGKQGIFLAFSSTRDSLWRLLAATRVRGWAESPDWAAFYADRWVAVPELRKGSIGGFNAAIAKVRAAWPKKDTK